MNGCGRGRGRGRRALNGRKCCRGLVNGWRSRPADPSDPGHAVEMQVSLPKYGVERARLPIPHHEPENHSEQTASSPQPSPPREERGKPAADRTFWDAKGVWGTGNPLPVPRGEGEAPPGSCAFTK